MVKEVVRAARDQGAKIVSRVVDSHLADACMQRVDDLAEEVETILSMEKEERALGEAEREVRRGENLVGFEDEIKSRPRRTWFETGREKELAKERGRKELNGGGGGSSDAVRKLEAKGGTGGKLSNKQKKTLDAKKDMQSTRAWKKGKGDAKATAMAKGKGKGKSKGIEKAKPKSKPKPNMKVKGNRKK